MDTVSNYGIQRRDWDSDAAFFSRGSKSLRPTFDLSSNKISSIPLEFLVMRSRFSLISLVFLVTRSRSSSIPSVFLPTCSYVLSNLALMLGISSRIGLNSALMASISTPTSVKLNLSTFLGCFSMDNIIMKKEFSVKQIILAESGCRYCKGKGLNHESRY